MHSLSNLIQPGIFGIVNNRNIYIGYSRNLLKAIAEQLDCIKSGTSYLTADIDSCEVIIIETCTEHLKEKQAYWVDKYISDNYKVVNTSRLLRYRPRIRVDKEFRVLVELVSKSNKSRVVGVFKKVSQATEFVELLRKNNPIIPLYADNAETREYLKDSSNLQSH
jgi:hypothetical protein